MITALPVCSITGPFVESNNSEGEECGMERDKIGWDGKKQRGVKGKKILFCRPDGFSQNQNEKLMEKMDVQSI